MQSINNHSAPVSTSTSVEVSTDVMIAHLRRYLSSDAVGAIGAETLGLLMAIDDLCDAAGEKVRSGDHAKCSEIVDKLKLASEVASQLSITLGKEASWLAEAAEHHEKLNEFLARADRKAVVCEDFLVRAIVRDEGGEKVIAMIDPEDYDFIPGDHPGERIAVRREAYTGPDYLVRLEDEPSFDLEDAESLAQQAGRQPIVQRLDETRYPVIPPDDSVEPAWEPGCGEPVNNASPARVHQIAGQVSDTAIGLALGREVEEDVVTVYDPIEAPFDEVGRRVFPS